MKALLPADRAAVAAAALVAALLIAQQVAGRALRDALFLSAYAVTSLPGMMFASAVVSVGGALAFAAAGARRSPMRVVTGALGLSALLFAGEWRLAPEYPRLVAAAVYVQLALLGPGIVSGFWSLVNERFDPHTARRVVAEIGTGASVGGVLGGVLAWAGSRVAPVPALLLGLSATSLLALVVLPRLRPAVASRGEREAEPQGDLFAGVRWIREFPYLRQLAGLVALGAFAEALLDYLLKAGAAGAFASRQDLAGFFSLFYACVALVTLAIQATITRHSLERVGLAGTVSFQPAAVALASAAGLVMPSLASAVVTRGLSGALRDSLFRSGYELFFAPLPAWRKRGTKALVDVAADKVGSLAGAGLVMALAALPLFSPRGLWLLALVAMVGSVLLARRLHQGYVRALEHSLRSGLVALEPDDVQDSTTRLTLTRAALDRASLLAEIRALHGEPPEVEDASSDDRFLRLARELRSGRPDRIRGALASMESADPGLTPLLIGLLARDDVFHAVLRSLRGVASRATGQLVDALLDSEQPLAVRRRIPRVLKACPTARAVEGLLLGLGDPDFAVRRECGLVLAWLRERHAVLVVPAPPVHAAAARELATASADPDGQLDHVFVLLSAVGEREPLQASHQALRGEDVRLRGTALEYLEHVLPDVVRQPLLRRLGTAHPAARPPRQLDEVEEELRQSAASRPRGPIAGRPRSRS